MHKSSIDVYDRQADQFVGICMAGGIAKVSSIIIIFLADDEVGGSIFGRGFVGKRNFLLRRGLGTLLLSPFI